MAFSLQEMMKNPIGIDEIPSQYLLDHKISEEENSCPLSIPIFDLHTMLHPQTKTAQLSAAFHAACKDWGIFQFSNHGGMDAELLDKLKHEIHEFYKLPLQDKLRFRVRPGEVEGYGQKEIMTTTMDAKVDWADRLYMITNPVCNRKPHLLPQFPPPLRETLEAYICEQQKVARAVLGLIAEALGMEVAEMEQVFDNGMQSVRMNYYPACPAPEKVIGVRAHSDGSGITFLLQVNGVEGFQVNRNGVWTRVQFVKDALVVNLGDIIEIMSNGIYKSIEHRVVVNSEKERLSFAMFFNPTMEAEIGPSQSLLRNHASLPVFRTIKADQYVKEFFARKLDGKSFLNYLRNM